MSKIDLKQMFIKVREGLECLKKFMQGVFIAKEEETDEPQIIRKKHLRLGILVLSIFIILCFFILEFATNFSTSRNNSIVKQTDEQSTLKKQERKETTIPGLEELAQGTTNERLWIEQEGKELELLKQKQLEAEKSQQSLNQQLEQDKVSKEELSNIINNLSQELEAKYNQKLNDEIIKIKAETQEKPNENNLESRKFTQKKKIKRIGEYIAANSYAKGQLLLGVDAGVGMTAESNPRQVLLRITGETISAGFGSEYLKTNRLIGCQMSAKAIGDISSEKVYLDGVLMTCAIDKTRFIEIPVKAYVTSMAKSGIRGEVISREGDLVLRSFLSGLASGFGSGINQLSQPQTSITGSGFTVGDKQTSRNLLKGSLGSGMQSSSDRLSDYFIKRAEQYQPVISINEGVEVYVVFQEGFSFKEDSDEKPIK